MSNPTPESFFLPYQRRWIEDKSPLKIMEKSRQIGMSWSAAYGLVREQAAGECAYDSWVSSRDELQAELFINDCAAFADVLNTASASLSRKVLDRGATTARTLTFAHSHAIHALSSNPNAQAGKRGTRLLDEFALHPDPSTLYAIALPGITWGGRLEIISTHRGVGNFFNKLIRQITEEGNPKGFSHHRVTLVDALTEGFLDKLKAKLPQSDPRQEMNEDQYLAHIRSQCPDEATFAQEYMCNPCADDEVFLPAPLVMAAQTHEELPADISGELYIGADIGRTHDLSVFWILERIDDHLITRELITLKNAPFATQEAILTQWINHPHFRHCTIDATGLGRQFAERLVERFGSAQITPLIFSDSSKSTLAYFLLNALQQRILSIPAADEVLADLLSIHRTYTPSGTLTFAAAHSAAGHADRFWALAMALQSANTKPATVRLASPPTFALTQRNKHPLL